MQEPIDYLAILDLQQALQGISQADGYYYDVRGTAVRMDPNHDAHLIALPGGPQPFVAIEVQPETREYEMGRVVFIRRPIVVHWICDSNPERDVDMLRTFFRGCADVERAIARDPSRGGYASDTRIVKCENNRNEDGSEVRAEVAIEIWTRRTYGEPSS